MSLTYTSLIVDARTLEDEGMELLEYILECEMPNPTLDDINYDLQCRCGGKDIPEDNDLYHTLSLLYEVCNSNFPNHPPEEIFVSSDVLYNNGILTIPIGVFK